MLPEEDVGHSLVISSTGARKSTLFGMLVAQWLRYEGAQVFLSDLGHTGYLLAKAAGGRHYDIAAGRSDTVQFQPLARIDDPSERSRAAEWFEIIFGLEGVDVTPTLRACLDRALELVAEVPRRTGRSRNCPCS